MTDRTDRDDEAQRISVLMMASGGVRPDTIAQALNISELQVRRWLRREPDDEPPDR